MPDDQLTALQEQLEETRRMVQELHDALVKPQPGHKEGLLSRMARVTIQIESGERVAAWLIRLGAVLAAVGATAAFFRFGFQK